jgi:hypothetical protein
MQHNGALREEDLVVAALKTADKIAEAIGTFGWSNYFPAKEHLGPIAWACVKATGGWERVCELSYTELEEARRTWQRRAVIELTEAQQPMPTNPKKKRLRIV